jgi:N-sulfoglucosamine sulfohydrolase
VDIVPTLLDASGIDCPPVAGRSLREVLQGKTPEGWRDKLFAEYTSHAAAHFYPRRSLRDGHWKLIHNLDFERANPVPRRGAGQIAQLTDPVWIATFATDLNPPEWELYNLEKDPFETVNLAGNPEYAHVLKALRTGLMEERRKTQDPLLDPAELQRLKEAHGL